MSTDWSEEHADGQVVDDAAILRAANAWAAAVEVVGQIEQDYEAACEAEGKVAYDRRASREDRSDARVAVAVSRNALDIAQQQAEELRMEMDHAVIEAYGGPLAKEMAARIRELRGRVG